MCEPAEVAMTDSELYPGQGPVGVEEDMLLVPPTVVWRLGHHVKDLAKLSPAQAVMLHTHCFQSLVHVRNKSCVQLDSLQQLPHQVPADQLQAPPTHTACVPC